MKTKAVLMAAFYRWDISMETYLFAWSGENCGKQTVTERAASRPARGWCARLSVCKKVVHPAFTEIQGSSVINGRGRAPLIVIPDTGTRP